MLLVLREGARTHRVIAALPRALGQRVRPEENAPHAAPRRLVGRRARAVVGAVAALAIGALALLLVLVRAGLHPWRPRAALAVEGRALPARGAEARVEDDGLGELLEDADVGAAEVRRELELVREPVDRAPVVARRVPRLPGGDGEREDVVPRRQPLAHRVDLAVDGGGLSRRALASMSRPLGVVAAAAAGATATGEAGDSHRGGVLGGCRGGRGWHR